MNNSGLFHEHNMYSQVNMSTIGPTKCIQVSRNSRLILYFHILCQQLGHHLSKCLCCKKWCSIVGRTQTRNKWGFIAINHFPLEEQCLFGDWRFSNGDLDQETIFHYNLDIWLEDLSIKYETLLQNMTLYLFSGCTKNGPRLLFFSIRLVEKTNLS